MRSTPASTGVEVSRGTSGLPLERGLLYEKIRFGAGSLRGDIQGRHVER